MSMSFLSLIFSDKCEVNNGDCGPNAVCSHDSLTNAATCTCQTGYINTGSQSNVVCTGKRMNKHFVQSTCIHQKIL